MLTGDELGTRSRDDMLAAVYREGARRRRRRQTTWLAGAAAVLLLAVAVPVVVATGSGDGTSVVADDTADDDGTPTTRTTPTTEATATTASVPPPTTPASAAPAPPTTADPCRNSTDPACGQFRWDPEPVDQPTQIVFSVLPEVPRAGDTVTVHVIASDPDGPVSTNCGSYFWGDPYVGPDQPPQIGYACAMVSCPPGSDPHGPWTPPAPSPGYYEETFTHTFSTAGTFSFQFTTGSDSTCPPGNPYQQPVSATETIVVAPAA